MPPARNAILASEFSENVTDEQALRIVEEFDEGVLALTAEIAARENLTIAQVDLLLAEAGMTIVEFEPEGRLQ